MRPRFAKVSEIADRFRVSTDAVYLWIRLGKIPSDCVVRISGTVRVDQDQFEQSLRSGALYHPRGRKRLTPDVPEIGASRATTVAEDSFTTVGDGPECEHRWTCDTGRVNAEHPFSPEMVTSEK